MKILDVKDQTSIFFTNEVVRYNVLIRRVATELGALIESMSGDTIITEEQDIMIQELLNHQVPTSWKNVSFETMKPYASWQNELINRMSFWLEWTKGKKPNHFNLGYFFFP